MSFRITFSPPEIRPWLLKAVPAAMVYGICVLIGYYTIGVAMMIPVGMLLGFIAYLYLEIRSY